MKTSKPEASQLEGSVVASLAISECFLSWHSEIPPNPARAHMPDRMYAPPNAKEALPLRPAHATPSKPTAKPAKR